MIYYLLPNVIYSNSIKINHIRDFTRGLLGRKKEKGSFNNMKYKVKLIGEYIKHVHISYRQ